MLDKNGDFLNHLSSVLQYIDENSQTENPQTLFNQLEKISIDLKKQSKIFNPQMNDDLLKNNQKGFEKSVVFNFKYGNFLQNFEEDNHQILSKIGKGLSKKDAVFVESSLHCLCQKFNMQFLFFGKIFTFKSDYYVIYSAPNFNAKEYQKFDVFDQKKFDNLVDFLNSIRFFVTSVDLNCEWIELKPISPKHVRAAKKEKILFSGILEKDLSSKNFPGCESEYLHAQLLRIVCATIAIPKGCLKSIESEAGSANDGLKKVVFDEENKGLKLSIEEASSLDNWVHMFPYLTKNGNFYNFVEAKGRSEEQLTEQKEDLEAKNPGIEVLSALSQDLEGIWSLNVSGSKSSLSQEEDQLRSQAVIVLENKNWQGSYCLYWLEDCRWSYFYTGFGLKYDQTVMTNSADVPLEEPKMRKEQSEPNFVDEPVQIENEENVGNEEAQKEDNLNQEE